MTELNRKKIEKSFLLQHDQSDCGVACLLSLIQYYNGFHSLEKLRELSGTNQQGTTLLGLFQAANKLGFDAQGNEADLQSLIDHGEPVILHVLIENQLQHYVVCYGFENEKFIIGDPGKGVLNYTKEELDKIWQSKVCLTLAPNEQFEYIEQKKKEKWRWLLSVLKKDKPLLAFSVFFGLLIAALGMVMAVFSQKLIDDILPAKDVTRLIAGISLVFILLIVRVGFTALRDYFLIRQQKDFNNRIIDRFYNSLLHLPKPFFDTRKIGELVARLNDTQRVQKVIQVIVSNFVISLLVTFVSLGFLFYYSWRIALITLASLPIYFLLIYRFNKIIIQAQKAVMQGYALSETNYITTMQGIATIKNLNRQSIFQKINQLIYGNFQEKVFNLGKINVRLTLISGVFNVIFLVGILAYSSFRVYYEQLELGELMAILGISGSLLPAVANLALVAIPINEAKVAFDRMYEFASIEIENEGNYNVKEFNSLEVKFLSFRFPGRKQLMNNVNFKIEKGKCVALIGENGSGKSTLAQIIQKFYLPEKGSILINENNKLKDINIQSWRTIIGVVPQEVTIFNGNVLDNIALGKEETVENIVSFCQKYGFENQLIKQLPQGYATLLGENGINLSGGQKQMIAFIRALYQEPQLLIIDEGTSAMDRKSEQFILNLLNQFKVNMGILMVTHRIHSLNRIADNIVIMEEGQTILQGSHKELLESENFYSEFFKKIIQ